TTAQPGQFICVYLGDAQSIASPREVTPPDTVNALIGASLKPSLILPRPFSIMHVADEYFDILFKVVGIGTSILAKVSIGQQLRIIGPLGNSFEWDEDADIAVLVAGGIGVAPFPFWAQRLKEAGHDVVVFIGARNCNELPVTPIAHEDARIQALNTSLEARIFAELGVPSAIAVEEPMPGAFTGTVVDMLISWLNAHSHLRPIIYACGPKAMLQRVQMVLRERNLRGQFSLEERMACGIGLCLGCACLVRDLATQQLRYQMVCTDGPVFDADAIVF
ncbi:MAG TPA: hypothetical protein EYP10_02295, partial [Armatimonadetes bacterium]|nr:hypothetical protein [Armatimonadota bacterium]